MQKSKIIIIGTSHISPESVASAKKVILKEEPDCVAVELCPQRYHAFLSKKRKPNLKNGIFYYILYWLQQELSKRTGVLPGTEMLTAISAGKEVKATVALIDKDIEQIMWDINKISFWEKAKLITNALMGFTLGQFSSDKISLKKVPPEKLIKRAILYLKKNFPGFYKVLVKDRNIFMANNIKYLSRKHKKIIVVVGAGHKKGIEKILKK